MTQIKDVMIQNVVTVTPKTHVCVAMELIAKNDISGLPVVDRSDVLVGIVSEKDLLGLLDGKITEETVVKDFMTEEVKTFLPEDGLTGICEYFASNAIRRIPIVNEEKHLVGIVSRRDLIQLVLTRYKKSQEIE